jgi:SAM-dependent methyltransferase
MAGISTHTRVAELIDPPLGGTVIDVGAGTGAFSDWLLENGYAVTAVGIEQGQYHGKAPFIECNVDDGLPFDAETIEGIVAIELIEHLEGPYHFIREAARCLRPNGWLVVTTPNIISLSSKVSLAFRNYPIYFGPDDFVRNGHISPISLVDLKRIALRAGLSVEVTTYNVGKLPIPRVRHRFPLRHRVFRNHHWGESLVALLRKTSSPMTQIERG